MAIRRLLAVVLFVGVSLLADPHARAETDIKLGYTAVSGYAGAYVAKEQGFFAAHGLNVELVPIAVNSLYPPALLSGSLQAAIPTPSVFLQAVDNGIDLVAVAGTSVMEPGGEQRGVLARPAANIHSLHDFAGKRVGVPGIGALLDVLFRHALLKEGVQPSQVTFVEMGFPQQRDALKSGSVDAVVSADPVLSRIVDEGTGSEVLDLQTVAPHGLTTGLYAMTRDWADAHPKDVASFRAAIAEGVAFAKANPQKANEAIAKYTKLPAAALAASKPPVLDPAITPQQLQWWVDVLKEQNLLQGKLDVSKLVLN
jgi:NitT/TauT family transport system substrate-binding protein